MVYGGVDLHRKRSHVVAVDAEGQSLLSRRIDNDPGEFLRIFGELGPEPVEVAFETTYGWGWFADLLADAGISTHMSHPLATKAITAARVKNDAVDARTLPHLLRTNLLPEAWIAPPEAREAKRLVRMRTSGSGPSSSARCMPWSPSTPERVAPRVLLDGCPLLAPARRHPALARPEHPAQR